MRAGRQGRAREQTHDRTAGREQGEKDATHRQGAGASGRTGKEAGRKSRREGRQTTTLPETDITDLKVKGKMIMKMMKNK